MHCLKAMCLERFRCLPFSPVPPETPNSLQIPGNNIIIIPQDVGLFGVESEIPEMTQTADFGLNFGFWYPNPHP